MRIPFAAGPHLCVTLVSIGVLIGTIASTYAGTVHVASGVFVWAGCLVMLRYAWVNKPTWADALRSTQFWIGVGLAVVGNIVWRVIGPGSK